MKENKIFSIFNNNTMEELALKVEEIDLLEKKVAYCVLIVSNLELDNGLRAGKLDYLPGSGGFFNSQSIIPRIPEEIDEDELSTIELYDKMGLSIHRYQSVAFELEKFLYFLKRIDENCFLELLKHYEKKIRKGELLSKIIIILMICVPLAIVYLVQLIFQ
jgi:hypothetical protein